jgi:hypothetical protein
VISVRCCYSVHCFHILCLPTEHREHSTSCQTSRAVFRFTTSVFALPDDQRRLFLFCIRLVARRSLAVDNLPLRSRSGDTSLTSDSDCASSACVDVAMVESTVAAAAAVAQQAQASRHPRRHNRQCQTKITSTWTSRMLWWRCVYGLPTTERSWWTSNACSTWMARLPRCSRDPRERTTNLRAFRPDVCSIRYICYICLLSVASLRFSVQFSPSRVHAILASCSLVDRVAG